ncbi:hypothetical protein CAPTEDRAFT_222058 [Capitella teleta]|uniref:Neurotransmitter-gated ion-channel ligand-binding domain-containing protein n=1 Tax=Capitella teleta TaxID=283909 RepID=R7TIY5_CAPTE|nr:hypothetical protein CAPTEDRAFT_222058 [Capitella teleta]|eukprot:ELT91506.1 hypothetical protein CAPTEDRAFT_222058 [Capitella teleta]
MARAKVLALLLSALLCSEVYTSEAIVNPRANLTKHLLRDYDPGVIPLAKASGNLTVYYHFILGRVDNLDEKNQVMTTYGWILTKWNDPFLSWDPDDFNDIGSLVIPGSRIWIPEIVLQNGVEDGKDLALDSDFRVIIYFDGTVMWVPSFRWPTTCNVDLTLFPVDIQLCGVSFMAWLNSMDGSMTFQNDESARGTQTENVTVLTGFLTENEQWTVMDSRVSDFDDLIDSGKGEMVHITSMSFALLLRRQPTYYIVHIIVPCLTISLVSMFMFYLPIESGEKVSFGITVLLSYTLLLLMINDITPKGGPRVPLLTLYIIFSMILSALALITTFFILRVHNHPPDTPVPRWARRLFLCHWSQTVHTRDTTSQLGGSKDDLKKLPDEEAVVKKQWENLARRLDTIAFVAFLSLYGIISLTLYIYVSSCASGSTLCQHAVKKF